MVQRFKDAYREGTVIPVDAAYAALTADVISHNCYGQSFNYLDQKDYVNGLRQAVDGNALLVHLYRFFPPLMKAVAVIAAYLPRSLTPRAADLFMMKRIIREKSIEALEHDGRKSSQTIFDALSDPAIPEAERSLQRLEDEALLVLGAGTETTARVMSVGLFYLLSNKTLFYRLRAELKPLMPTPDARPTWNQLEELPYLTSVINEALRLTHVIPCRLPRIAPKEDLQFNGYTIPAGTPVSQSICDVHLDPYVFPNPHKFEPDRWIEAAAKAERLDRYLVPFSRGTRQCMGLNLAYSEMYLTFAVVVRWFDLELHETSYENIRLVRELIMGLPEANTISVKVKVVGLVTE
ncbi:Cytochrome P450 [Penicillium mononematosum]|uniref:Cytochrome P450 n=1 Tax=Penicillium mononematosum TaxID=268346 RepID=UPI0025476829|nr:Cytochrome P450 [Penicillium mononematosum]KAJ6186275.1 Cytochrome P450 [Penicillium mononematosum]